MAIDNKVSEPWEEQENIKNKIRNIEAKYPIITYLPQLFKYDKNKVDPYVNMLESLRLSFANLYLKEGNNKEEFFGELKGLKSKYFGMLSKEKHAEFRADMNYAFKTYFNALTQDILSDDSLISEENKKDNSLIGEKDENYISAKNLIRIRIDLLKEVHSLLGNSFYEQPSFKDIPSIFVSLKGAYQQLYNLKHKDPFDYI